MASRYRGLLVNAMYSFIGGLIYPTLPLYLKLSGFTVFTLSMAVTAMYASGMASSIIWGRLISNGRLMKAALLAGSLGGGLGYLALSFLRDAYLIAIVLVFLSIVTSGIYPSIMSMLSEAEDPVAGLSYFWVGGSLGYAIATSFSGYVLSHVGMWMLFLASAIIYASSSVILLSIAKSPQASSTSAVAVKVNGVKASLKAITLYIASVLLLMTVDVIKNIYIPMYYAFNVGIGPTYATMTLGVEAFLEIPAILAVGRLIKRGIVSPWRCLGISLILASTYLTLNALVVKNLYLAFLAMSTYAVVWATFSVSSSVIVPSLGIGDIGTSYGIYNAVFPLANIVTPIYMGIGIGRLGYGKMLIYEASALLLLSLIVLI